MKKIFGILLIFITLPGCFRRPLRLESTAHSDIRSIPRGFAPGTSFSIVATESHKNDLQAKELADKIQILLLQQGYTIQSPSRAEYVIVFHYSMKDYVATVTSTRYVPGQLITSVNPWGSQYAQTSGTYAYVPEEQQFFVKCFGVVVYPGSAFGAHKNKKPVPVWQASTCCNDQESDLRFYLDFLLVELFSRFGLDLGKSKMTNLYENNKEVEELRESYRNLEMEK